MSLEIQRIYSSLTALRGVVVLLAISPGQAGDFAFPWAGDREAVQRQIDRASVAMRRLVILMLSVGLAEPPLPTDDGELEAGDEAAIAGRTGIDISRFLVSLYHLIEAFRSFSARPAGEDAAPGDLEGRPALAHLLARELSVASAEIDALRALIEALHPGISSLR